MGDILKEAIADAKAVRETALANAKMALEEAFTPQLKSMLSAKLKEDEDEDEVPAEEGEHVGDEEVPAEEGEHVGDEEVPAEDAHEGEHEDGEPEETYEDEEVPAEETYEDEEVPAEETYEDEVPGEEEEGKLDLEAIIRELESELSEDEDEDEETEPVAEGDDDDDDEPVEEEYEITLEGDDDDDDDDAVEEQSDSSKIGTGDNKVDYADAGDEEDPGKGKLKEVKAELKEYKDAVVFLKDKLHEVNILNAKLLFTNKLFKQYSLDNNQKLKVVETFDRAQTTREIKLVYSTLAEQFSDNGSIVTRKSIKESASSTVGSTKPSKGSRKVITEETKVANRFKKLAGLIK